MSHIVAPSLKHQSNATSPLRKYSSTCNRPNIRTSHLPLPNSIVEVARSPATSNHRALGLGFASTAAFVYIPNMALETRSWILTPHSPTQKTQEEKDSITAMDAGYKSGIGNDITTAASDAQDQFRRAKLIRSLALQGASDAMEQTRQAKSRVAFFKRRISSLVSEVEQVTQQCHDIGQPSNRNDKILILLSSIHDELELHQAAFAYAKIRSDSARIILEKCNAAVGKALDELEMREVLLQESARSNMAELN